VDNYFTMLFIIIYYVFKLISQIINLIFSNYSLIIIKFIILAKSKHQFLNSISYFIILDNYLNLSKIIINFIYIYLLYYFIILNIIKY
jgi:hypothetical protein